MIQRIDHLGIAVRSLDAAIPIFEKLLGRPCDGIEIVESQKVKTAFFHVGEVAIELLEPTDASGPIAKFLENKGVGLHHLALATDATDAELSRVTQAGIKAIDQAPREGAHGKQIAFLHPKSTSGVLVELCSPPEG
ncbi:MAG: methylmalonyl-CoA epimerase [Myxococcales bacterium]|jgi:methylmalonyl-CoA/ethylmalonyl-CoA epimerase|nr:methylmalonyl-CoA epimerase [Myxococcales bacterium]